MHIWRGSRYTVVKLHSCSNQANVVVDPNHTMTHVPYSAPLPFYSTYALYSSTIVVVCNGILGSHALLCCTNIVFSPSIWFHPETHLLLGHKIWSLLSTILSVTHIFLGKHAFDCSISYQTGGVTWTGLYYTVCDTLFAYNCNIHAFGCSKSYQTVPYWWGHMFWSVPYCL